MSGLPVDHQKDTPVRAWYRRKRPAMVIAAAVLLAAGASCGGDPLASATAR